MSCARLTVIQVVLVVGIVGCRAGDRGEPPPPVPRATPIAEEGSGKPPREIPPALEDAYTMNGEMAVHHSYRDDSYSPSQPRIYTREEIARLMDLARQRKQRYYGVTDEYLYQALDEFKRQIDGKEVAIMGSTSPWYESIVLSYGGKPTTIEYNALVSEDPRLRVLTVEEYEANPTRFDAVLSISSYEHDGLGRYGDPLNPNGDLGAMKKTLAMLRQGGLLFLAVPVGQDAIFWNVHRVYGRKRLPRLLEGWRLVRSFGFEPGSIEPGPWRAVTQPVFVLTPGQP